MQQWSAEIPIEGVMQGAFTWAWVKALMAGHLDPPIRQLTHALRAILADLRRHFLWMDQTPVELLAVVPEETAPPATRPRSQQADSKGYRLLPLMELNRLAAQLPAGSKLTMILDCSYPLVPNLGPANNLAPTFPKVSRGRVDYSKLHDFVSRPRF